MDKPTNAEQGQSAGTTREPRPVHEVTNKRDRSGGQQGSAQKAKGRQGRPNTPGKGKPKPGARIAANFSGATSPNRHTGGSKKGDAQDKNGKRQDRKAKTALNGSSPPNKVTLKGSSPTNSDKRGTPQKKSEGQRGSLQTGSPKGSHQSLEGVEQRGSPKSNGRGQRSTPQKLGVVVKDGSPRQDSQRHGKREKNSGPSTPSPLPGRRTRPKQPQKDKLSDGSKPPAVGVLKSDTLKPALNESSPKVGRTIEAKAQGNSPRKGTSADRAMPGSQRKMEVRGSANDLKGTPRDITDEYLQEMGIFKLNKRKLKFPRAKYFCRLCNYHMDNLRSCEEHAVQTRHIRLVKNKIVADNFADIPDLSPSHLVALTEAVEGLVEEVGLTDEMLDGRKSVSQRVNSAIQEDMPDCQVDLYGSSLSGFGFKTSDVNLNLKTTGKRTAAEMLVAAHKVVEKNNKLFGDVGCKFEDKFPVIYFTDIESHLYCELGTGSDVAVATSRLLLEYRNYDPRARLLVIAFRHWARLLEIDRHKEGSIPAYVYSLMVIYFLQRCEPAILPVLQGNELLTLCNDQSVGALWVELLHFYLVKTNLEEEVISIKSRVVPTRKDLNIQSKRIIIDDPCAPPKKSITKYLSSAEVFNYIMDCFHIALEYFSTFKGGEAGRLSGSSDQRSVQSGEVLPQENHIREQTSEEINLEQSGCVEEENAIIGQLNNMTLKEDGRSMTSDDNRAVVLDAPQDERLGEPSGDLMSFEECLSGASGADKTDSIKMDEASTSEDKNSDHSTDDVGCADTTDSIKRDKAITNEDEDGDHSPGGVGLADKTQSIKRDEASTNEVEDNDHSPDGIGCADKTDSIKRDEASTNEVEDSDHSPDGVECADTTDGIKDETCANKDEDSDNNPRGVVSADTTDVIERDGTGINGDKDGDSSPDGVGCADTTDGVEDELFVNRDEDGDESPGGVGCVDTIDGIKDETCINKDEDGDESPGGVASADTNNGIKKDGMAITEDRDGDDSPGDVGCAGGTDGINDEIYVNKDEDGDESPGGVANADTNNGIKTDGTAVTEDRDGDNSPEGVGSAHMVDGIKNDGTGIFEDKASDDSPEYVGIELLVGDIQSTPGIREGESEESPDGESEPVTTSPSISGDLGFDFVFDSERLSGGQRVPKVCSNCQMEGHISQDCEEDKLPDLLPLPPMQDWYLAKIQQLCDFVSDQFTPKKREFKERSRVVEELERFIQYHSEAQIKLALFGSSVNGFGFQNSDLDICMTFDNNQTGEGLNVPEIIQGLGQVLRKNHDLFAVTPITTAKVPIVKFTHRPTQLEGDISLYNLLAQRNTKLLYTYAGIDKRVCRLGHMVKAFAKECGIADASRGSLSSYAYILMTIYFLQQTTPPVIPVLQELYVGSGRPDRVVEGWNTWFYEHLGQLPSVWKGHRKNKQTEAELFLGFLRFYTETFDFDRYVVSIRQHKALTRFQKMWMGTNKGFTIEDPFDLDHNLGGALSRRMSNYIMLIFRQGRERFGTPQKIPYGYYEFFFDYDYLTDGQPPPNDRGCRICGKIGHFVKDCPIKLRGKERKREKKEARAVNTTPQKKSDVQPVQSTPKTPVATPSRAPVPEKEKVKNTPDNAASPVGKGETAGTASGRSESKQSKVAGQDPVRASGSNNNNQSGMSAGTEAIVIPGKKEVGPMNEALINVSADGNKARDITEKRERGWYASSAEVAQMIEPREEPHSPVITPQRRTPTNQMSPLRQPSPAQDTAPSRHRGTPPGHYASPPRPTRTPEGIIPRGGSPSMQPFPHGGLSMTPPRYPQSMTPPMYPHSVTPPRYPHPGQMISPVGHAMSGYPSGQFIPQPSREFMHPQGVQQVRPGVLGHQPDPRQGFPGLQTADPRQGFPGLQMDIVPDGQNMHSPVQTHGVSSQAMGIAGEGMDPIRMGRGHVTTPPGHSVAPPHSVTPPRHSATPPRHGAAPPRHVVTPPGHAAMPPHLAGTPIQPLMASPVIPPLMSIPVGASPDRYRWPPMNQMSYGSPSSSPRLMQSSSPHQGAGPQPYPSSPQGGGMVYPNHPGASPIWMGQPHPLMMMGHGYLPQSPDNQPLPLMHMNGDLAQATMNLHQMLGLSPTQAPGPHQHTDPSLGPDDHGGPSR